MCREISYAKKIKVQPNQINMFTDLYSLDRPITIKFIRDTVLTVLYKNGVINLNMLMNEKSQLPSLRLLIFSLSALYKAMLKNK